MELFGYGHLKVKQHGRTTEKRQGVKADKSFHEYAHSGVAVFLIGEGGC